MLTVQRPFPLQLLGQFAWVWGGRRKRKRRRRERMGCIVGRIG